MDRLNAGTQRALSETPAGCEPRDLSPGDLLAAVSAEGPSLQERMARIVRTIEADIIPRLVRAHRVPSVGPAADEPAAIADEDVVAFVRQVLAPSDRAAADAVAAIRDRGASVECIYLELLQPAARRLGRMWEDDDCLFSDVTVAVGRLQRIMRALSPDFGTEVEAPADGRRVLLVAAPGEQHVFGLAMVAEFFRRAGWDVARDLDPRGGDVVAMVRDEWFDVAGLSVGGTGRVECVKSLVSSIRRESRNRAIGVMVGGPLFNADPAKAALVGADATTADGSQAPRLAEQLLGERACRL